MNSFIDINDLPVAPTGRTGWPWTEATPTLPNTVTDGAPWPRISIVTPSFNQGQFIEETIRSVLLQGYPNLEYIIIDGGSTDESVEIIKKYEPWLKYWVSEQDRSQSHAINKGFAQSTGDILNWLCSDDCLTQNALNIVASYFVQNPTVDIVVGGVISNWGNTTRVQLWDAELKKYLSIIPHGQPIAQPSCFYKSLTLSRPGPVDETYHYMMDLELWAYFRKKQYKWLCIDDILSVILMTGENKTLTGGNKALREFNRIQSEYVDNIIPLTFWLFLLKPLDVLRKRFRRTPISYSSRIIRMGLLYILGFFYGHDEVRGCSELYTFFTN